MLYVCEAERKTDESEAVLTRGSHYPQAKWSEITQTSLLLSSQLTTQRSAGGVRNKVGVLACGNQVGWRLLHQRRSHMCYVLDEDESLRVGAIWQLHSDSCFVHYLRASLQGAFPRETREDFNIS